MKIDFQFGDCRKLIKNIPNNSVDLILTDPPYIGVVKAKWDLEEMLTEDLIEEFSSGMLKRSELAIADLKKPDVLCIDEPKVYLDESGIQLLLDLLNYRETQKITSILSSQESINALSNIERTIDLND